MKHTNPNPTRKGVVSATPRQSLQGFTLIEMMVVLLLVSILAAIAIPSYRTFVVRNTESEVQSIMQNQAIQLKRWRAKTLNYQGYDKHEILVPAGSTTQNYRYKITIVDGQSPSKPLNSQVDVANDDGTTHKEFDVSGQNWMMLAEPNPAGRFQNANKYFMNSEDERCYVDHSNANKLELKKATPPNTPCSGSEKKAW